MLAKLGGLLDKPVLAFLEEIVIAARPEAPRITGRQFPAKSRAPKHRHDFDAQLGAQIEQAQQIILGPLLNFTR